VKSTKTALHSELALHVSESERVRLDTDVNFLVSCNYIFILHRFRDPATYWPKAISFCTSLAILSPYRCDLVHSDYMRESCSERISTTAPAVLTK